MARAEQLLRRADGATQAQEAELPVLLEPHRRGHTYVDPYRLTSSMLGRGRRPEPSLLTTVFL
jgi:hypothetical protein